MNSMLSDDDLTRLLGEAAEGFPVSPEGPAFVVEELMAGRPRRPRRPTNRVLKSVAAVAAVAAVLLVIQGQSGSGLSQTSVAASDGARGGGSTGGSTGTTTGGALPDKQRAYDPAAGTQDLALTPGTTKTINGTTAPEAGSVAAPNQPAGVDGARIVKTGTLGLVVEKGKVPGVTLKVRAIADGLRGYVSAEKSNEIGDDPTSTLTLRVPVASFEAAVTQARATVKDGVGKVESASSTGRDITAQYADVSAKIQSLSAARERFLTILAKAKTISEILSVQQRVDEVQGQIDSLRGQIKVLSEQSDLSTITITVSEKTKAAAKTHEQSGISRSWDRAKHGFSSGVEGLIARSGRALLALIIAAFGLVVLRLGWRLARRRMV